MKVDNCLCVYLCLNTQACSTENNYILLGEGTELLFQLIFRNSELLVKADTGSFIVPVTLLLHKISFIVLPLFIDHATYVFV